MHKLILAVLLFMATAANAQQKLDDKDLQELKSRLEGTFDNQEQAQKDPAYRQVILQVKEISFVKKSKLPFKKKGKGPGYWLYTEEAQMDKPNKPFRQYILHISKLDDETLVGTVYEMSSPMRFAGAWRDPAKLKSLTPDSLTEEQGCEWYLKKDENGNFYGATAGKNCMTAEAGATYATGELTIYSNMMIRWTRDWNSVDEQVGGPQKSGYKYRKYSLVKYDD